jgi:hypothetical protein
VCRIPLTGDQPVGRPLHLSIQPSIHDSTALLLDLGRFSVSWSLTQTVGLRGWGISPPQGRYLHIQDSTNRINAYRYPWLKWDSNLRSSAWAGKTVHTLDRAATVIGPYIHKATKTQEKRGHISNLHCDSNPRSQCSSERRHLMSDHEATVIGHYFVSTENKRRKKYGVAHLMRTGVHVGRLLCLVNSEWRSSDTPIVAC